jgi:predicted dehydrogenase
MGKIKIGQIGVCHEHASGKMNSIRQLPELFEVVGVVDDRSTTAAKYAGSDLRPYEGLRWLSEEELLNYPGLQAVLVEVPNTDLVPVALRCMERGLAMHMDKPGGEDLALFGELLAGCKARQLPFQMGYMFRGNPAMQWCLKAAEQGWLGEIFEVQSSMSHNYGDDAYQEYLGKFRGGIMFNLCCHFIDFVVALLGRPTGVTTFLKNAPGTRPGIVNNALSILDYPAATVSLRACSKEINGLNGRRLKICGSKGTADLCPVERFDGQPLMMQLHLQEANADYPAGERLANFGVKTDRYVDQLMELAQIIKGEIPNPDIYDHDYLVQEILLAASGYSQWEK